MRTFIVTKNGVARVMRTYPLGMDNRTITPDMPADTPIKTPAPDATDVIAAQWHSAHSAAVTSVREIAEADVPALHEFKDAWRDSGAAVDVDMPEARNIHMGRIRVKRDKKLAGLDLAYMIADENGDNPGKAAIAQQKKALRDLPATHDLSGHTTPESLKDDWPVEVQ